MSVAWRVDIDYSEIEHALPPDALVTILGNVDLLIVIEDYQAECLEMLFLRSMIGYTFWVVVWYLTWL